MCQYQYWQYGQQCYLVVNFDFVVFVGLMFEQLGVDEGGGVVDQIDNGNVLLGDVDVVYCVDGDIGNYCEIGKNDQC